MKRNAIEDYVRPEIMEDLKYGMNIISGDDYRMILYGITNVAANLVMDTLGPYGSTLLVEDGSYVYPSKDGWASIKRLMFENPVYNNLFRTIRSTSFGTVTRVGDGSTSTMLGANFFLQEVLDYINTHDKKKFRQPDFLAAVNKVKKLIVDGIENHEDVHRIEPTGAFDDIYKVAYISSNGNEEVAKIIQNIYQMTNGNTHINFGLDYGVKLDYEIVNGYKADCKPFKIRSYRNREDGSYTRTDPARAFFFDHNITYTEHQRIITAISQYYAARNEEVIIFAPYFDDIMAGIIENMIQTHEMRNTIPNICFIQVATTNPLLRNIFSDMSVVCNANIFDHAKVRAFNEIVLKAEHPENNIDDALTDTEAYSFHSTNEIIELCAGIIRKAVITESSITIEEFMSVVDKDKYADRVKEVKEDYLREKEKAERSSTILMKGYQNAMTRFIKLQGNIGQIKIGAETDEQKLCLRDSIEDAVFACKSAYENGYMRGLNLTTLSVISDLINANSNDTNPLKLTDMERDILFMFYRVFYNITTCILETKYSEEDMRRIEFPVGANLATPALNMNNDMLIDTCTAQGFGYNLVTNKMEDRDHWTVIEPMKTNISIINSITSVLTLLLTSSQYVSQLNRFDKISLLRINNEKEIEKKRALAKASAEGFMEGFLGSVSQNANGISNMSIRRGNEDPVKETMEVDCGNNMKITLSVDTSK